MATSVMQQLPPTKTTGHPSAQCDQEAPSRTPLWPYTWGRIFRFLRWPFTLLYRIAVTRTVVLGEHHLHNLPARVILAGTHRGFADVPLVIHALDRAAAGVSSRRMVVAVAGDQMAGAGLLGHYATLACGLFPLWRGEQSAAGLQRLAQATDAGNALLIFPQGRHARPDEEIDGSPGGRFRRGVAYLASDLDAVVVPFGLAGTDHLIPPQATEHRGLIVAGVPVSLRRGPLAIAFGVPLRRGEDESPRTFTNRLQAECLRLSLQAEAALSGCY